MTTPPSSPSSALSPEVLKLIGGQRAELAKAGRIRMWMILAQISVALAAIASVFINAGPPVTVLALFGVLGLGGWLLLDRRYQAARASAGRGRRASVIMGGLGQPVSAVELLSIRETFSEPVEVARSLEDPDYFASTLPPGWPRLAEMLQEAAFWTSRLQAESARVMWAAFLVTLTIAGVALFFSIAFADAAIQDRSARIVLAVLALLMSSDIFGAAIAHGDVAATVERIVTRLSDAEARGYPQADLMLIFSDYNAVVEAAPIAVPRLYELHRDRLNALFLTFHQTR